MRQSVEIHLKDCEYICTADEIVLLLADIFDNLKLRNESHYTPEKSKKDGRDSVRCRFDSGFVVADVVEGGVKIEISSDNALRTMSIVRSTVRGVLRPKRISTSIHMGKQDV